MKTNATSKKLHPRNKHNSNYAFQKLIDTYSELKNYVTINKYGNESVDFGNPDAVRALNKALLKHFYEIEYYEIPKTNLYPPIPGRADYIHYIADLLAKNNSGEIPKGNKIKVLDIGTGANCIYPIIGQKEYGWDFVATDVDKQSIKTASEIINNNFNLNQHIEIRIQNNKRSVFKGIITEKDYFDISICNPPFHNSKEEANKGTLRKLKNLGQKTESKPVLNFGGQNNELWCEGGEMAFITNMIYESVHFKNQVKYFTTLVSKKENLKSFFTVLKKTQATYEVIDMEQGNKISRILVWNF
ncbi:23S rRNA (adenine(1618)-N(6))-methyltransferase RlmF [Flavobacterium terrae]|uniref:Ribosomal RNA large subunit methyltransferase F n=1 Tax=Flavobacterium terrae TaxID=415425 RepID=A0A1M6FK58_9FLAO|nr:23S rRNA (adenine(1618)-N(6))-methyltransferase RlmF [Flavobacterium terrae]SHI98055.1 23S rRNA m(6)A-1618 methyltransferase [Flavobacterium terrae]